MQHRAIRLMASKLAVAGIIEGNFTDEGLSAMSECLDMTTAPARELTNGIKNEVEDLSAVFKKMAILKPAEDIIETTVVSPGAESLVDEFDSFPDDFDPFADEIDQISGNDDADPFAIAPSELIRRGITESQIGLYGKEIFLIEAA